MGREGVDEPRPRPRAQILETRPATEQNRGTEEQQATTDVGIQEEEEGPTITRGTDADGRGEQELSTTKGGNGGETALPPTQPVVAQPERVPPEALFVEGDELNFLVSERMSKLVPTPRAAKRLANTYRLLRASLDEDEMRRFLPQPGGEFRIAAVLLGTVIGFPNQAERLFRAALASDAGTWWSVVDEAQDHARGDSSSGKEGKGPAEPVDDVEALDRETWGRLHEALTAFRQAGLPEELGRFRYWIPKVGRFSFQTGLLDEVADDVSELPSTEPVPG